MAHVYNHYTCCSLKAQVIKRAEWCLANLIFFPATGSNCEAGICSRWWCQWQKTWVRGKPKLTDFFWERGGKGGVHLGSCICVTDYYFVTAVLQLYIAAINRCGITRRWPWTHQCRCTVCRSSFPIQQSCHQLRCESHHSAVNWRFSNTVGPERRSRSTFIGIVWHHAESLRFSLFPKDHSNAIFFKLYLLCLILFHILRKCSTGFLSTLIMRSSPESQVIFSRRFPNDEKLNSGKIWAQLLHRET